MKFSEWLGGGCCVMGVALMMLGSFLVPVNAPLWADPGFGGAPFPYGCTEAGTVCVGRSSGVPGTPSTGGGANPCYPEPGYQHLTCVCKMVPTESHRCLLQAQ